MADVQPPAPATPAAVDQFPCAQCGANLRFRPGTDSIKCDFCGHENAIPKRPWTHIEEQDLAQGLAKIESTATTEEKRTVKCGACAAEFTFDPNVHAASCPFCGSAVVAETKTVRVIQPAALVPFELDDKKAQDAFKKWLGHLWFAPNDLTKFAAADGRLAGMYVPYWTYDAQTYSAYDGERGDAYYVPYTVTRTVDGKTVTETEQRREIRWSYVSGNVERFFDDMLVVASRSLPKKYADRLDTWRLSSLQPYRTEYLAGFRSEVYQVSLRDGFAEAKKRMEDEIRSDVRDDIGGDEQRIHNVNTRWEDLRFKHVLLPVWLAAYRYRGKVYQILINGQTGEVEGARPYSWIKIGLAALAAAIVAGVVIWLVSKGR
ncbi:MAG TPA: primosomal protein N' (replication factor Y) - superfamily II helicase [Alphaproteobacteria bacterium]|jgi:DNA-directed RNA polymerase subunit RPC12/RpoP